MELDLNEVLAQPALQDISVNVVALAVGRHQDAFDPGLVELPVKQQFSTVLICKKEA